MKIELINQQRIKRINLKQLRKYLEKVLCLLFVPAGGWSQAEADQPMAEASGRKGGNVSFQKASFLFCDNSFIKKLNKRYFKRVCATDVISFPLRDDLDPDYLGEVVVSVEEAVKAAKKLKCKWQDELNLYLIHGILHLAGFDDTTQAKRKRMEKKQERILKIMDSILLC